MLCSECEKLVLFETLRFETLGCEDGQDDGDLMCVICGAAATLGGVMLIELIEAA